MEIQNKKGLQRVVLLERDESGDLQPETLWRPKKKKKGSKPLRGIERHVRAVGKGQKQFADTLLRRHRSSNRKRKDGWLKDLGTNVFKAYKKSGKSFK